MRQFTFFWLDGTVNVLTAPSVEKAKQVSNRDTNMSLDFWDFGNKTKDFIWSQKELTWLPVGRKVLLD